MEGNVKRKEILSNALVFLDLKEKDVNRKVVICREFCQ
jgi:hypothetical protein